MLFVQNVEMHGRIAQCAHVLQKLVNFGTGQINVKTALTSLLRCLHQLCAFWRQKEDFSVADLQSYHRAATQFGSLWAALGWKVSTWVHWTVRHSSALANLHKIFIYFRPSQQKGGTWNSKLT